MPNKPKNELRHWYLVYTKPKQEKIALDNILRQGYEAFLPMIKTQRRRSGRYIKVIEPMFSRYLMISLNCTTDNWSPIRSTRGAIDFVRFGMNPAILPDEFVNELRKNLDKNGIQDVDVNRFHNGDEVRICDGPMKNYYGIYQANSGEERAIVLLEIAGCYARLGISEAQIEMV